MTHSSSSAAPAATPQSFDALRTAQALSKIISNLFGFCYRLKRFDGEFQSVDQLCDELERIALAVAALELRLSKHADFEARGVTATGTSNVCIAGDGNTIGVRSRLASTAFNGLVAAASALAADAGLNDIDRDDSRLRRLAHAVNVVGGAA